MHGTTSATLLEAVASRRDPSAQARGIRIGSVFFIAALTAALAQLSVSLPFTQVPFTFQPTVVLLGGLVLGARLGCAGQLLYLAAGVAGLPVFAMSPTLPPGPLRLLGPTGGYLMAYPMAAFLTGYLAERGFDRRYVTSILAMCAGLVVIYSCGMMWLGLFARTGAESAALGLRAALVAGVAPFVLPDLVKLAAAAGIGPGLWRLVGRTR